MAFQAVDQLRVELACGYPVLTGVSADAGPGIACPVSVEGCLFLLDAVVKLCRLFKTACESIGAFAMTNATLESALVLVPVAVVVRSDSVLHPRDKSSLVSVLVGKEVNPLTMLDAIENFAFIAVTVRKLYDTFSGKNVLYKFALVLITVDKTVDPLPVLQAVLKIPFKSDSH